MTAISVDAQISQDHPLLLSRPQDFPAGPVKVTIESVRAEVIALANASRPCLVVIDEKRGRRIAAGV